MPIHSNCVDSGKASEVVHGLWTDATKSEQAMPEVPLVETAAQIIRRFDAMLLEIGYEFKKPAKLRGMLPTQELS